MNPLVINSIGLGLKLLPFFIQSLETLFGAKTGQTKKQAAQELFDAATLGAAAGFGLVGDQKTSEAIRAFQPAVDQTIDLLAASLFPTHSTQP